MMEMMLGTILQVWVEDAMAGATLLALPVSDLLTDEGLLRALSGVIAIIVAALLIVAIVLFARLNEAR